MRLSDLVDTEVVAYAVVEMAVGHTVCPDRPVVVCPVAVDPGHARACLAQDDGGVWRRSAVGVRPAHLDDLSGLNSTDREWLWVSVHVRMTVPCVVVLV